MTAKLYHCSWFKHTNEKNDAEYQCGFDYYVEGLGKVSIKTVLPKPLAEQIDAIGKQALWEKIGKTKKGKSNVSKNMLPDNCNRTVNPERDPD